MKKNYFYYSLRELVRYDYIHEYVLFALLNILYFVLLGPVINRNILVVFLDLIFLVFFIIQKSLRTKKLAENAKKFKKDLTSFFTNLDKTLLLDFSNLDIPNQEATEEVLDILRNLNLSSYINDLSILFIPGKYVKINSASLVGIPKNLNLLDSTLLKIYTRYLETIVLDFIKKTKYAPTNFVLLQVYEICHTIVTNTKR